MFGVGFHLCADEIFVSVGTISSVSLLYSLKMTVNLTSKHLLFGCSGVMNKKGSNPGLSDVGNVV